MRSNCSSIDTTSNLANFYSLLFSLLDPSLFFKKFNIAGISFLLFLIAYRGSLQSLTNVRQPRFDEESRTCIFKLVCIAFVSKYHQLMQKDCPSHHLSRIRTNNNLSESMVKSSVYESSTYQN